MKRRNFLPTKEALHDCDAVDLEALISVDRLHPDHHQSLSNPRRVLSYNRAICMDTSYGTLPSWLHEFIPATTKQFQ